MIAEHCGVADRQSARTSQLWMRPTRIGDERLRRVELHAPAVANQERRAGFRDQQRDDQRADESMAEIAGMQPPQERRDETEQDGFSDTIERRAVERAAEVIGPEEHRDRRASPQAPRNLLAKEALGDEPDVGRPLGKPAHVPREPVVAVGDQHAHLRAVRATGAAARPSGCRRACGSRTRRASRRSSARACESTGSAADRACRTPDAIRRRAPPAPSITCASA